MLIRLRGRGGNLNRNLFVILASCLGSTVAQPTQTGNYQLVLPDHKGKLSWSIDGFNIVENSAKPNGKEIGVRGRDASGRLTFLSFLFLAPETAPMTSAACRDAALMQDKKTNSTLKIIKMTEISRPPGLPIALATYSTANRDGSPEYRVRGFVAVGDICGDLEFYSGQPVNQEDEDLKKVFGGYQLDPNYTPQFGDISMYAQVLFQHHDYRAAAPIFEKALNIVPADGGPFRSAKLARRVTRDQAGMSYGMAGQLAKARSIFEKGIVEDPDYPMYYYNLACADAGDKKLNEAKTHLQQAFDRKANINPGETMPVPTEDDSFLPYKNDREFRAFLVRLQAGK